MRIPKEGTLRHRIYELLKDSPTQGFRPPQVAEKLNEDAEIVGATMAQMSGDEGEGLLTRCKVMVPGQRDSYEYRIAAAAGGEPKAPAFTLSAPRTPFRRDENQAPLPSNHGRTVTKDGKTAPEKRKPRKAPAQRPRKAKGKPGKRSGAGGAPKARPYRKLLSTLRAASEQVPGVVQSAPRFGAWSDGSLSVSVAAGDFLLTPDEAAALYAWQQQFARGA